MIRRDFLRGSSVGLASALLTAAPSGSASAEAQAPGMPHMSQASEKSPFDVRHHGATGDGNTIDTPAVNRAIDAAAAAGGGTVYFPAGTYACYTIRLKSRVALYLNAGATILAAEVPSEGTSRGGYDPAGPPHPWEAYQDFGHSHWANSLIYGEDLEYISITGPGRIWGKGLSRGEPHEFPLAESPGVGNKAIGLKNCRNVTLRDFSILMGGHFGVLLTGTDNVIIDGLRIDTNRDGIDIDCCRNVRVSNCAVNSPWDDAICPKSSFALGYLRSTENVTITNCYVTGAYKYGSMLDGTWQQAEYSKWERKWIGRIKCGTESNGGFKNIAISNCVFDSCRGLALETVDGAQIEDIAISNLTMRNVVHSPLFLRLGKRMRGPKGMQPGVLRRVVISNIVSSDAVAEYPSIIAGVPGAPIEDIKISDVYLHQLGGGVADWAARNPPELPGGYPEASMFGILPATGFFIRNGKNLEFSNVEIATARPDARAAFWAKDVDGLDVFRLRLSANACAYNLHNVQEFRSFGSQKLPDKVLANADQETF